MEFDAPPLPTEAQLNALQELLGSHYVEQDLPEDLLAVVIRYLKHASAGSPTLSVPGTQRPATWTSKWTWSLV